MKKLFVFSSLFIFLSCKNTPEKKGKINTNTIVLDSLENNFYKPEKIDNSILWLEKFNSIYKTQIIEFKLINDSLTSCVFAKNDGICLTSSLVTYINKVRIDSMEVGIGCDHELSYPKYEWKEYEFISPYIIKTKSFKEYVNDSLIDENGKIKEGYDFIEVDTEIDSVINLFKISSAGKIVSFKN